MISGSSIGGKGCGGLRKGELCSSANQLDRVSELIIVRREEDNKGNAKRKFKTLTGTSNSSTGPGGRSELLDASLCSVSETAGGTAAGFSAIVVPVVPVDLASDTVSESVAGAGAVMEGGCGAGAEIAAGIVGCLALLRPLMGPAEPGPPG